MWNKPLSPLSLVGTAIYQLLTAKGNYRNTDITCGYNFHLVKITRNFKGCNGDQAKKKKQEKTLIIYNSNLHWINPFMNSPIKDSSPRAFLWQHHLLEYSSWQGSSSSADIKVNEDVKKKSLNNTLINMKSESIELQTVQWPAASRREFIICFYCSFRINLLPYFIPIWNA